MEILLTGFISLIGILVAFIIIRAKLKVNKELDVDILIETTDLRILTKIESQGLISTFNSKAHYLKIGEAANGIWILKTRGSINGSGYSAIKLIINQENDSTSIFNFRLINLEIGNEEGKIIIENSSLNRIVLTFNINTEKDIKVLNELQNSIK